MAWYDQRSGTASARESPTGKRWRSSSMPWEQGGQDGGLMGGESASLFPWETQSEPNNFLTGGGLGGSSMYQGPNVTPGGVSTRSSASAKRYRQTSPGISALLGEQLRQGGQLGAGGPYKSSGGTMGRYVSIPQAMQLQAEAEGGAGWGSGTGTGSDYGQEDLEAEWEKELPWLTGTGQKIAETSVRRTMGNAARAETSELARSGLLGSGISADVERRRKENLTLRLQNARDMVRLESTLPYLAMKERGVERAYEQRPQLSMARSQGGNTAPLAQGGYTAAVKGGRNMGRRYF